MKYLIKTILPLLLFLGFAQIAVSQNNVIDEIAWVVGNEAILKSEIEEYRKYMIEQKESFDGDPYCIIPERLAMNKLFLDQAKFDSIEVKPSEINQYLEAEINRKIALAGSVSKLEEYMGKKMKEIREYERQQITEQYLIQGVIRKHFSDIKLTPSDIRKFFNKIPSDSLPFIPTTVELQIITMQPKVPAEEIDAVKKKLREYTNQINSGEKEFSTIALLYSEDAASAVRGGELGFMSRAQLVPEFASAAFALSDPKKVSNIVETEYGYHIIQLIEKRGEMGNFRNLLLKPKVPQAELDSAMVRLDSARNQIVENKISFDEIAIYSSDKDSRNNRGIMVNKNPQSPYASTPRFELNELNPDIAKISGGLEIGEISKPFVMTNNSGKKVVAIIKVSKRNEGHKANINNDYQIIKEMARSEKQAKLQDEWLKEKIKTVYVRIDPAWRKCKFKYEGWIK